MPSWKTSLPSAGQQAAEKLKALREENTLAFQEFSTEGDFRFHPLYREVANPYGMAVQIQTTNRKALALVNEGVVPAKSSLGDFFVFPYAPGEEIKILSFWSFIQNFHFVEEPVCEDAFYEVLKHEIILGQP